MATYILRKIISILNYPLFPLVKVYWIIFKPTLNGVKVIITYGDEVLLVKHAYGGKTWTLPGGGIRNGESVESAARREIEEELSLSLTELKTHNAFVSNVMGARDHIHVLVAKVQYKEHLQFNAEIEDARWFHIHELKQKINDEKMLLLKKCFEIAKFL